MKGGGKERRDKGRKKEKEWQINRRNESRRKDGREGGKNNGGRKKGCRQTDRQIYSAVSKVCVCCSLCDQDAEGISGGGGLWSFAVLSQQLTFHLQQLHRQTEQELSNIQIQWVSSAGIIDETFISPQWWSPIFVCHEVTVASLEGREWPVKWVNFLFILVDNVTVVTDPRKIRTTFWKQIL